MTSTRQKETAKVNVKKAQLSWQEMSPRERALAQPQGRQRAKPGTTGEGNYYRIVVRSKNEFVTFRYHDVGDPGHIQRLAGKRTSGTWDTQAWLISKQDAHMSGNVLVPDTEDAKKLIDNLATKPRWVKGDVFEAKDRENVPERRKPTPAQLRASRENIKKAQQARRATRTKNG